MLLHELGSGGMATVYLALVRANPSGPWLAVKCCHPHLQHLDEFSAMFRDEVRVAARVRHPNVVETIDGGRAADGTLFMVMRHVNGFTLAQILAVLADRKARVPPPIAKRIAIDVLRGLHAAHELRDDEGRPLKLVHRDVSPPNILVGIDGVSRIADFGIAKAASRGAVTREGRIKGKLAYMAPEQHGLLPSVAAQPLSCRTDVFAAGVVTWEMLAGEPLFLRSTEGGTVKELVRATLRPPSTIAGTRPSDVDAVVLRALEIVPTQRFQSAADFADAQAVRDFVRDAMHDAVEDREKFLVECRRQRWSVPPHAPVDTSGLALRRFSIPAPGDGTPVRSRRPSARADSPAAIASIAAIVLLGTVLASVAHTIRHESRSYTASWASVASIQMATRTTTPSGESVAPPHADARRWASSAHDRGPLGLVKKPVRSNPRTLGRRVHRRARH